MNTLRNQTQPQSNQPIVTQMGSEVRVGALHKIQKNMQSEGDDLLRMEDEGGTPLSSNQTAKVDGFFKISKRIRREFLTTKTPTT